MNGKIRAAGYWFLENPRGLQVIIFGITVLLTLAALTGLAPSFLASFSSASNVRHALETRLVVSRRFPLLVLTGLFAERRQCPLSG